MLMLALMSAAIGVHDCETLEARLVQLNAQPKKVQKLCEQYYNQGLQFKTVETCPDLLADYAFRCPDLIIPSNFPIYCEVKAIRACRSLLQLFSDDSGSYTNSPSYVEFQPVCKEIASEKACKSAAKACPSIAGAANSFCGSSSGSDNDTAPAEAPSVYVARFSYSIVGTTPSSVTEQRARYRAAFATTYGVLDTKVGIFVVDAVRLRRLQDSSLSASIVVSVECSNKNEAARVLSIDMDASFTATLVDRLIQNDVAVASPSLTISKMGVTVKDGEGNILQSSELYNPIPSPSPTDAGTDPLDRDKAVQIAKQAVEGLTPVEVASIGLGIISSLCGLYFAYKKFVGEKKKVRLAEENANLERRRIEREIEIDSITKKAAKLDYRNKAMENRMKEMELAARKPGVPVLTVGAAEGLPVSLDEIESILTL